jgi:hypothetical protein
MSAIASLSACAVPSVSPKRAMAMRTLSCSHVLTTAIRMAPRDSSVVLGGHEYFQGSLDEETNWDHHQHPVEVAAHMDIF